jgi:DNA polymerase III alpha subunit (gram-positive type)
MPSSMLALDTETTGLDPEKNSLLEISAIPLDDRLYRKQVEPFHVLIRPRPGCAIDRKAIDINGHEWAFDPKSTRFQEALDYPAALTAFQQYIEQHFGKSASWIVPVGWCPSFDIFHLKGLYSYRDEKTSAISPDALKARGWPFHYHTFDLMTICRYLDVAAGRTRKSYALDKVARELFSGELVKGMHTSAKDVEMMLRVFRTLEKR